MSNIDVIGDLLQRKVRNNVDKKVINMKKIFDGYTNKRFKKTFENPFHHTDPKNYAKAHKKKLIFKKQSVY